MDGRRQIISLTPRGTALISATHAARIEYLAELLGGIGSRQLTTTVKTLSRIRDNAAVNSGTDRV